MKWTLLKGYLKEYWWVIAIIVATPPLLNFVLSIPAFCRIVGIDTDWLSFYGGYIGAVITSLITLYVLYKQLMQNHKENDANRALQLKIFQYEQKRQWLSEMRRACLNNLISYNANDLREIRNAIRFNSNAEYILNKFKYVFDNIANTDMDVVFLLPANNPDKDTISFNNVRMQSYTNFTNKINTMQSIYILFVDFFDKNPEELKRTLLTIPLPEDIKDTINKKLSLASYDVKKVATDILDDIAKSTEPIYKDIRDASAIYLHSEERRINEMLQQD